MRAPRLRSASTRSPIGRSCMRATPDSRYSPPQSASTAVSGRNAVPALPSCSSADLTGKAPPAPRTVASGAMRTPRRPSASSITRVSSESSRSWIFVSPCDSAARSRTRLEMLFDPGILTVPQARAIGSRSRCFTGGSLTVLDPTVAGVAGAGEQRLQPLAVAALEQLAQPRQLALVAPQLGEQRLAVRHADVAPHLGAARGDAREVAESARGVREQALRVPVARHLVDEREREHVRQVADGREHRVVLARLELEHARAAGGPRRAHPRERVAIGALQRREHDLPAAVELGEGRPGPALLGPGDRVPGHEAG